MAACSATCATALPPAGGAVHGLDLAAGSTLPDLGAAMAGPVVLQPGFAPPNQDLGLAWFVGALNGQHLLPAGQGGCDGPKPALIPQG
jgi:hypothetical protein